MSTEFEPKPPDQSNFEPKLRRGIVGASLSEPHIDEFAVNFPYIYIYLSYVVP